MPRRTIDVLICNHHRGPELNDDNDRDNLWWFQNNKFFVTPKEDVWVGRLPETERVMDACVPAGLNFKPVRQFGWYYALVNEMPANPDDPNWDIDQRLTQIAVFSRFVFPTRIGYEYCARIHYTDDGAQQIIPLLGGARVYGGERREWLTCKEWRQVKCLLSQWDATNAPACERLNSAIWYREKMAQEYYLEVRWMLLVTAIESLIGLWSNGNGKVPGRGKQFVTGVCRIAEECKLRFDASDAEKAWRRRSSLVHGAGWPTGALKDGEPSDNLHGKLQHVLDATICRMIEEPVYRFHFEDDVRLAAWLQY
ncbi:MAG: hypothetical protein JXQ75_21790 [Phycisphaerae bacterium]|nr:hypothetical protein [Phycisphaerae bacterium]